MRTMVSVDTCVEGNVGQNMFYIMAASLLAAWNEYVDAFNEQIADWNFQWDELHPNVYVGAGSPYEKTYLRFIRSKAQPIVDKMNEKYANRWKYEFCIDEYTQLQMRLKNDHSAIVKVLFKTY